MLTTTLLAILLSRFCFLFLFSWCLIFFFFFFFFIVSWLSLNKILVHLCFSRLLAHLLFFSFLELFLFRKHIKCHALLVGVYKRDSLGERSLARVCFYSTSVVFGQSTRIFPHMVSYFEFIFIFFISATPSLRCHLILCPARLYISIYRFSQVHKRL